MFYSFSATICVKVGYKTQVKIIVAINLTDSIIRPEQALAAILNICYHHVCVIGRLNSISYLLHVSDCLPKTLIMQCNQQKYLSSVMQSFFFEALE